MPGETQETRDGSIKGTGAYMSPEVAEGRVADIDEVSERLNVHIEREGFETVGGYLLVPLLSRVVDRLVRMPPRRRVSARRSDPELFDPAN